MTHRFHFLFHKRRMTRILLGLVVLLISLSAQAQNISSNGGNGLYFPPNESGIWEEKPLAELGWHQSALAEMLAWLPSQDTRAFLILKDGKIVIEEYWGSKLTGVGEMDQNSFWYWASSGKTLTAALIGLAEEEKLLKIKDPTQKYLGKGWTAMPDKQERKIKLIHHLSFTTGIDDSGGNLDDFSTQSLKFLAKPGTRWSYHNATYSLLEQVIGKSSGMDYQSYFKEKLGNRIGMKGFWQKSGMENMFYSDARSMARFGLLLLAEGNWNGNAIWSSSYFEKMTQPSQDMNPSYGYLTWLNGKSYYKMPGSQVLINDSLVPQAPTDMYMALGENGQFLMIVPSQNMVIVRMGGAPGDHPVPDFLVRQIWERFAKVIQ